MASRSAYSPTPRSGGRCRAQRGGGGTPPGQFGTVDVRDDGRGRADRHRLALSGRQVRDPVAVAPPPSSSSRNDVRAQRRTPYPGSMSRRRSSGGTMEKGRCVVCTAPPFDDRRGMDPGSAPPLRSGFPRDDDGESSAIPSTLVIPERRPSAAQDDVSGIHASPPVPAIRPTTRHVPPGRRPPPPHPAPPPSLLRAATSAPHFVALEDERRAAAPILHPHEVGGGAERSEAEGGPLCPEPEPVAGLPRTAWTSTFVIPKRRTGGVRPSSTAPVFRLTFI